MGGGSNSSPPSDVAPGGGTYPVNSFGEVYNPAWGNQGFNWGTFGRGLQQGGNAYAQSGQGGAQSMARMDYQMTHPPPVDVNDQGLVIGTDKRIYDLREMQALQDALRRIDATTMANPPRDFRENPTRKYAMPRPTELYGTDEGLGFSF